MMKYYSALKKNEVLSYSRTWINLEGVVLSEVKSIAKR